jgi:hypothetical protein
LASQNQNGGLMYVIRCQNVQQAKPSSHRLKNTPFDKHERNVKAKQKASDFNIFLVFSNVRGVLSQCKTWLRLLYLLNNCPGHYY